MIGAARTIPVARAIIRVGLGNVVGGDGVGAAVEDKVARPLLQDGGERVVVECTGSDGAARDCVDAGGIGVGSRCRREKVGGRRVHAAEDGERAASQAR